MDKLLIRVFSVYPAGGFYLLECSGGRGRMWCIWYQVIINRKHLQSAVAREMSTWFAFVEMCLTVLSFEWPAGTRLGAPVSLLFQARSEWIDV